MADTRALQHYLGHKNIQHTVRYTENVARPFQRLLERLLRLVFAALNRTNRRVHMLKQSVGSLVPGLFKFRRGGQRRSFSRPLDHLGVIAGARREHRAQRRKRRL